VCGVSTPHTNSAVWRIYALRRYIKTWYIHTYIQLPITSPIVAIEFYTEKTLAWQSKGQGFGFGLLGSGFSIGLGLVGSGLGLVGYGLSSGLGCSVNFLHSVIKNVTKYVQKYQITLCQSPFAAVVTVVGYMLSIASSS